MKLETEALFWLCSFEQIPFAAKKHLSDLFHGPEGVFHASFAQIRAALLLIGIREQKASDLAGRLSEKKDRGRLKDEVQKMQEAGITLIGYENEAYPKCLKQIAEPPFGLFVCGQLPKEDRKRAAVIGARTCSTYGKKLAQQIGEVLAGAGVEVISGAARGIDGAAHAGALKACGRQNAGGTYAVLGCGPDVVYPKEHRKLYDEIVSAGGLISEYPPGTPPLSYHFPQRNRIISALSDGVIVVEADEKSGSLITVSCALDQGKEIWAVPGRISDRLSRGTNRLLKDGAFVFTEPEDVLSFWNLSVGTEENKKQEKIGLDKNLEKVYSCLDSSEPKSLSAVINACGLDGKTAAEALIDLELEGLISQPVQDYFILNGEKSHLCRR